MIGALSFCETAGGSGGFTLGEKGAEESKPVPGMARPGPPTLAAMLESTLRSVALRRVSRKLPPPGNIPWSGTNGLQSVGLEEGGGRDSDEQNTKP